MIRFSKPVNIGSGEKDAVLGMLEREYLGMGNGAKCCEEALSSFFESKDFRS